MSKQTPNEFYADRGLVRTSITLDRDTIQFLADYSTKHSQDTTKVTQGEVVIALTKLLQNDQRLQAQVDEELNLLKLQKLKERTEMREQNKLVRQKVRQLRKEGKDPVIELDLEGN